MTEWEMSYVPYPDGDINATTIACGFFHCLALKMDGSIVAWMRNDEGQCDVPEPNSGFVDMAGGPYNSFAIKAESRLTVNIEPQAACEVGAQWRRTGTETWLDSGATESGLAVGTYMIEFMIPAGWSTPGVQSITIETGITTSVTIELIKRNGVNSWIRYQ